MGRRAVIAAMFAVCIAATALLAQQRDARSQPPPPPPTGTGRISGVVVAADSGAVVRGAKVTIAALQLDWSWISTTDDDGRFDLQNLPAATYTFSIQKAGFVEARPPNVELKEKTTLDRGKLRVVRGGVITGRIVDARGEPVIDANVGAARMRYVTPGPGSLYPVQSSRTNDLGEFRVYGLQPGTYVVYAGFGGMRVQAAGVPGEPRVVYANANSAPALTFYPGASRASDAQTVEVKGGESTFVDLRLISVPLATISGQVVDSKGMPALEMVVLLSQPPPYGALNFRAEAVLVDAQGRFTINNLQPGDYHADVLSRAYMEAMGRSGSSAAASRELNEIGSLEITVDRDLKDLAVQTARGFDVRGRVTVDGATMPSSWLPRLGLSGGLYLPSAEISSDGTFVLRAMPGHRRIQVIGFPAGSMVERILVRGQDVADDGFDVTGDIAGVEIAFTTSPPVVAGRVVDANGDAVEADVLVYVERTDLWTKPVPRYVKNSHSTIEQGFRVTGLLPGRYLAVAVDQLDEFDWANPANLERLRSLATPITLAKGETKTLALTRR